MFDSSQFCKCSRAWTLLLDAPNLASGAFFEPYLKRIWCCLFSFSTKYCRLDSKTQRWSVWSTCYLWSPRLKKFFRERWVQSGTSSFDFPRALFDLTQTTAASIAVQMIDGKLRRSALLIMNEILDFLILLYFLVFILYYILILILPNFRNVLVHLVIYTFIL